MRKKLLFAFLYFAEGAPIGFIWWVIPSVLTEKGHSLSEVSALMALATLPWSFKFIFAPFIDILSQRQIGLKKQLLFFQSLMALSALFFAPLLSDYNFTFLAFALVAHALSAASQDICIDALAIKTIPDDQMGQINGYMQAGRLIGTALFGGLGIYIVSDYGIHSLVFFLCASIALSMLVILLSPFHVPEQKLVNIGQYFKDLKKLVRFKKTWFLLGVAFFTGFSFKGIDGITSATLVKLGVDSDYRALFYGIFVPLLTLIGALAGGYIADRISKAKALKIFLALMAIANLMLSFSYDQSLSLMGLSIFLSFFYLSMGFVITAMYAFLMKNSSKEFAAFEFSTFMALLNLCESTNTYIAGQLTPLFGYVMVSSFLVLLSFSVYFFLSKIKRLT